LRPALRPSPPPPPRRGRGRPVAAYSDDAAGADEQYKGQTIEVTGTIAEVAPSGERYVSLAPNPAAPASVQCFFERLSRALLASLRTGQSAGGARA
jgi:tRNA_anti-like